MRYFIAILFTFSGLLAQSQVHHLIVGTYTSGKSEGIYVYKFNAARGIVLPGVKVTPAENPSYLVVSPDQSFVYAVNSHKGREGEVSAYAFDKVKGELKLLNKQPTGGENPVYVTTDSTGKFVVVANYEGGNLSVFSTNADGSLKPYSQLIQHEGYSVNYTRQDKPHVHCVEFSPDQQYLFAADLGTDKLYQYKFNPANTSTPLTEAATPYQPLPDGSGPRHFTFHPNGKTAYLVNELSGTVTVYSYSNGEMKEIQSVVSTTAGDKNDRGSADIHVTDNGKFLYASNRGKANDITIYKLSMEGRLNETGRQAVNENPRNFVIDPSSKFLLSASRAAGTIQVFSINPNFGLLENTGVKIDVDMPACLKLVPTR